MKDLKMITINRVQGIIIIGIIMTGIIPTIKISFIDVFYHQSSERHPGHTARAPPITRGGRVRTGDQTTASPMP
jgi:hypothetical protein